MKRDAPKPRVTGEACLRPPEGGPSETSAQKEQNGPLHSINVVRGKLIRIAVRGLFL